MLSLDDLHLMLLCGWGGVIAVEFLVELLGTDHPSRENAARYHYFIDMLIEMPLLLGILATGIGLAMRDWPLSTLLLAKIALGTSAISANVICLFMVVARHRARDDEREVLRWHRRIRWTALGVPFGLAAAALGFLYYR